MKFSWKKNTPANGALSPPAAASGTSGATALSCRVYSMCETGPVRTSNEDAVCTFYPDGSYGSLFAMVADGMGGHNAGEVASRMACEVVESNVRAHFTAPDTAAMLADSLRQAHQRIQDSAAGDESMKGMGTTSTMLLIRNGMASYAHVGDSRLYRWSGGTWQQITNDHTLVNRLIQDGEISPEEAGSHPMKNIITQAVGYSPDIEPEVSGSPIPVAPGDRFLLISDGVTDVISGEELGGLITIRQPDLLLECIRTLCTARRTSDNFSVILITISDDLLPLPSITKEQNAVL